jgi:hypothetical protein
VLLTWLAPAGAAAGRAAASGPIAGLSDGEFKAEVADPEREVEPAKVMDHQGGKEDQDECHQKPKQPPEESRYVPQYAHAISCPLKQEVCQQSMETAETSGNGGHAIAGTVRGGG